ncbi:MAG: glycosyltransferase, partial [bacterium]|nr:glycosyltransferase [bacterium]
MKKLSTSIIIPTYKRLSLALALATKISSYNPSCEIIIVDQNDKKKQSLEIIRGKIKIVTVNRISLSYARNIGTYYAQGNIVVFLDDDVEVVKKTIIKHLIA